VGVRGPEHFVDTSGNVRVSELADHDANVARERSVRHITEVNDASQSPVFQQDVSEIQIAVNNLVAEAWQHAGHACVKHIKGLDTETVHVCVVHVLQ
jgi:hypothetical protein